MSSSFGVNEYTQRCRAPLPMAALRAFHRTIWDKFSFSFKCLLI
jgi:hypothetical protein